MISVGALVFARSLPLATPMSLDVKLNRVDRVYRPQEQVSGVVVVNSPAAMSFSNITLVVEGTVTLQLSARSVGLFEAFYSSLQPVQLMKYGCSCTIYIVLRSDLICLPLESPAATRLKSVRPTKWRPALLNSRSNSNCVPLTANRFV
jgi:hypothetical protein